jgi:hypothetical protein
MKQHTNLAHCRCFSVVNYQHNDYQLEEYLAHLTKYEVDLTPISNCPRKREPFDCVCGDIIAAIR